MKKIFNQKVIKKTTYKKFQILFTENDIWVCGFGGFPPQWAENLIDAKELINLHLAEKV